MKINRHGITLSLISFLIAGAPVFAQDGSSWASPGTASASETDSTAVGAWANAGKAGTALGSASYAHAPFSTSVGMSAYVNPEASNGVAVGSWASADALNSVALGTGAQAMHRYSVALGQQSGTTRENEVYIGYDSGVTKPASPRVPDKTRVLGGVSDGTRDTDAATVGQLNRKADEVYSDVSGRIAAEALKARDHTDTVAAENRENIIRNTVAINRNTRGLLSQRDVLETHEERLNSQQQQINTGSTVAVDSHGYVTRGEGTGERITVQEGLVRTQEMATENRAAVSRNRQVGERNSRAIASQARTLQAHERRMNSQQRQINENHEEMKRAAAQSAALAGLFQPYSVGKFNATAAVGGYSDKQAVAVGMGYRFNEQAAAKAGTAFSDGDVSWNVGVNWEF
ncbi:YadA-like family protein [Escherichia coli]|uniref:YadA-like family protein n=1 Tax=Escherichia coli TaxID=562 RepID=UPI0005A87376|nr:YadA-like family protein [Escherichia coli]EFI0266600.1 hemagglutinin [Escherichia coli]EFQ5436313.1 hemagglutinin [Escherichia coli]EHY9876444.1 YadA-like family protein [Escherichia coli]EKX1231294.1 YadA-like family protein [Escherichia coli]EKX3439684.1 YadA-like family protein [Escherichia coli]